MRMPGPYYDDNWDWLPSTRSSVEQKAEHAKRNAPARFFWESGVVLLVPLAGAAAIELILKIFRVY